MNCKRARLVMLEAEPADLRGEGDAALAAHLVACDTCRAAARRMLAQLDLLAEALARVRPTRPVAEALAAARLEAHRRRRRCIWLGAAPALAAAGLAGLVIAWPSQPSPPQLEPSPAPASVARTASPPVVESSPGSSVAVFQTENPNIVVVWLLQPRSKT